MPSLSETPATTDMRAPALRRNSTGPAVDDLKQLLSAVGLDPGPRGEPFDARTHKAVVDFQRRAGLQPDGRVGPSPGERCAAPPTNGRPTTT